MITNDNISSYSDGSYDTTDDEISITSASSSKEENIKDLVLSKEENQGKLAFGNIAVVNSSNVHFGNKTVYEGPVTIKQFLYAKPQTNSDLNDGDNKFSQDNKTVVPDSVNSNNNINLGFAPSETTIRNKAINCNSNSPGNQIKKDLQWLRNIVHRHLPLTISLSTVLLISLVILMSVLITRHRPTQISYSYPNDTNEQDGNFPATYPVDSWSIKNFLKNHIKLLVAAAVIILLLIISITCAIVFTYKGESLTIITRVGWIAQPVAGLVPLTLPVGYVIISETQTENCEDQGKCVLIVRLKQSFDIDSNNRTDISYNFLVGGDGAVYEGRGWNLEGAHTYGYNSRSIGIAIIGTFINQAPFPNQIRVAKKLIEEGLKLGYIVSNYKLFANRQLEVTQNPGQLLYDEIKTWPHWQKQ